MALLLLSKTRIYRDDQREGCEDFLFHLFGSILRVASRTVHLTMLRSAVQLEHGLLTVLGLTSALNESAQV